jgi:hypothetical protein
MIDEDARRIEQIDRVEKPHTLSSREDCMKEIGLHSLV